MKKISLLLIVLFATITITAQNWETNFETAKIKAQEQNKQIILVFSGSDWCTPCIKLDHDIFQSKDFLNYANENWVLYKADFPRKKKNKLSKEMVSQNNALADKYNTNGYFPLVLVLEANGNEIGKTTYKKIAPKAYVEHLKSL